LAGLWVAGTGLYHRTHQADVLADQPPGTERYGGTAVATRWPHRIAEVREQRPSTLVGSTGGPSPWSSRCRRVGSF
jgi:hypothetical protein